MKHETQALAVALENLIGAIVREQRQAPAPQRHQPQSSSKQEGPLPRLVTLNEAARMTSLSRTMVNRYRLEGRFPQSVVLGDRRIAFVREEIEAWIDEKMARNGR